MTIASRKITAYTNLIASLADVPNLGSTSALKQYFDSSPEEVRVALNGLIDDLLATVAGASGADQVGSAAIAGVAGNTVYAQLLDLKAQIQSIVGVSLPTGSISTSMIQDGAVTHLKLESSEQTASVGGKQYAFQTMGGF